MACLWENGDGVFMGEWRWRVYGRTGDGGGLVKD